MESTRVESVKATYEKYIKTEPTSIPLAQSQIKRLFEELADIRGELVIGNEKVVDEIRYSLDKLKLSLEGEDAHVDDTGALAFGPEGTHTVVFGTIKPFCNGLPSVFPRKKSMTMPANEASSYSAFPPNGQYVQMMVARDEYKRASEKDKAALQIVHLLSLLSFAILELHIQKATWARTVYHLASYGSNGAMVKFCKRARRTLLDEDSTKELHLLFHDLLRQEDHMNPPGKDQASGSGLRYPAERDPAYTRNVKNPDAYVKQVLEIQERIRSDEGVNETDYRLWLTALEFKATGSPSRPYADTPANKAAINNVWNNLFRDATRHYIKKMAAKNEPLPLPEDELIYAQHIEPRGHAAVMAAGDPPAPLTHLMANGEELQMLLKGGEKKKANLPETNRVIIEDFSEMGGGTAELGLHLRHTERTYFNYENERTIVTSKHNFLLNTTSPGQVGSMCVYGNTPANASRCMSDKPWNSDPSAQRIEALGREVLLDTNEYDFEDAPAADADDTESAKRPLDADDAETQAPPKRVYSAE